MFVAPAWALLAGFLLLVLGGEALVRGAASAARALKISPLLIGIVLVGFGTSAPELVTSLEAASRGSPGIAVGAVVGSNIANVLLILGLAAVIQPLTISPPAFRRDGGTLALVTAAAVAVILYGRLDSLVATVFLAALLAYVWTTIVQERRAGRGITKEAEALGRSPGLAVSLILALVGVALTVAGARLLVGAALVLARDLGMSETVIGLTIVAVGTSLPEVAASVMAALRRHAAMAFGNVVGSNIYNVLGILGVTGLVTPIPVPREIARLDVWIMAASAALLVLFVRTGHRLSRWEGALLLATYTAYLGWTVLAAA